MGEGRDTKEKEIESKPAGSTDSKSKDSDTEQDRKSLTDVRSFSITVPYIWR